MVQIPNIWIAIFVVWLSEFSTCQNSPKLIADELTPVKAIGSNWTIECVGDRPVTWNYTYVDDRTQVTRGSDLTSNSPFSAVLTVSNVSHYDVQTYKCHYAAEDEDEDWSSINCRFENVTCAHLFVDDENNLLANSESLKSVLSYVGLPLAIPCMPTSPQVTVTLSNPAGNPIPHSSYLNTEGYFINSTTAHDAGFYTCDGTRGTKSEFFHIVVHVQERIDETPVIDWRGANAVKSGDSFTLNCSVETASKSPFKLEWTAPKAILSTLRAAFENGAGRVRGSDKTLTWKSVKIENATKADDSVYECTLWQRDWKKNATHVVDIYDYGDEFLNVTTHKYDIEVNESASATWAITRSGFPKITEFDWRDRNNASIRNSRFSIEVRNEKSLNLKINNVRMEDAGIYYFFASNVAESITLKLNLTVWGVPSVTIQPLDTGNSEGEFYPFNGNVSFKCVASGVPYPEIDWLFNNCTYPFNHTFNATSKCQPLNILSHSTTTFDADYGRGTVSIITANFQTSGYITCEAINNHSTPFYISSPKLNIKLIDFTDTSQTGFVIEGNLNLEPIEKTKLVIVCAASKGDYKNLEWFASPNKTGDSVEILLQPNATTVINGVPAATQLNETNWSYKNHLVLEKVAVNHSGVYFCKAESHNGTSERRSVGLDVQSLSAPVFDNHSNLNDSKIRVAAGFIIDNLECSAIGVPPPTLTWLRDGVPSKDWLPKFKKLLTPNGNGRYDLKIPSQPEYSGNYTCRAENDASTVERFMLIEIIGHVPGIALAGIVAIVILSIFVFLLLCWVVKTKYNERKLARLLIRKRRREFQNGDTQNINPELPVSDQVNLLPYYDTWEFPKDKLKLGIQLGSGAFGRVVKAEALGIVDHEESTTVAVKMVKPNCDDSHINALVSELKIMVHLGKHINVVNLLGACTKDLAKKKELLVIVEYCRYGSLLSYLHRHRNEFVDQLNPVTGDLDKSITRPDMHSMSPPRLNYAALTFTDSQTNRTAPNGYRFLEEITSPGGAPEALGAVSYNPSDDYALNSNVQSVCTDMSYVSNSVVGTDGRRRSSSGSTWNGHYRGDYQPIDVRPITTTDLLCWSFQIAQGMEYLASRKVLHGDLAARNVLLSDDNVVKICDFGLAKEMYQERYNKKSEGVLLPVKWMAIESICFGVFSSQSDVWSYGVVLWELFTLGKNPYPGMEIDQRFYTLITEGYRMEKPALAPSAIFDLMINCWNHEPSNRPIFSTIGELIGDLMDDSLREHYIDLNENYSRENRIMMEEKEDYLIQMGGADFVFKEPTPEPDRTYANVEAEPSDSNYLEPTKPSTSTKYENLNGGPIVQQLANNAGYIFMNTHQMGPNEPLPEDIFSPRPVDTLISDENFTFDDMNSNKSDKLPMDANILQNNRHEPSLLSSNSNSRSPLEEIQGVSNMHYVPNNIFSPEAPKDFANNKLYEECNANSNHKIMEGTSANKRVKNDSGVSSLGSANDFKIPSNSSSHGDYNGHDISIKDNQLYFQTNNLTPFLINGSKHDDSSVQS